MVQTPYDLESVMHYGANAVLAARRPAWAAKMGQRRDLSKLDAEAINKLYCS